MFVHVSVCFCKARKKTITIISLSFCISYGTYLIVSMCVMSFLHLFISPSIPFGHFSRFTSLQKKLNFTEKSLLLFSTVVSPTTARVHILNCDELNHSFLFILYDYCYVPLAMIVIRYIKIIKKVFLRVCLKKWH